MDAIENVTAEESTVLKVAVRYHPCLLSITYYTRNETSFHTNITQ